MRDNDLFLTMLASPNATMADLVVGGLTPENTALHSRDYYLNNDNVKRQFQDENGDIDYLKYDEAYNQAKQAMNYMSNVSFDQAMSSQLTFHRDDYTVPYEMRRKGPDFREFRMDNPYEQVYGLVRPGEIEQPTKSVDELAQSHNVLLNPTTAGANLENAQWGGSPNDNFWKYFATTLVLAQYDKDTDVADPYTGEITHHKKGDLKLNNDGEFYYEKLDGRSIVGKKVLNKMNILTTDGSWANQYDFFDSDDIKQKSLAGTTMKNLALVGSMFLPYVGWWITGFSVAFQAAGFLSALSRMAGVADNSFATDIEGFVKSWDSSTLKTDYAQQNTWCVENFIDMVADFLAFTRQQRLLFQYAPAVFKGGNAIATKEGLDYVYATILEKVEDRVNQSFKAYLDRNKNKLSTEEFAKAIESKLMITALKTQSEMASFVKDYNHLGEIFSRSFIIANGAANTYEEALNQGANKRDAAILTLGHAAGTYGILKTGIGKWIFPELRYDRYRQQAIARAISNLKEYGGTNYSAKTAKLNLFKRIFNAGRNLATADYSTGLKSFAVSIGTAFSGAVEMTSFDVLRDLSNSCYNLVKWLNGDEHRLSAFAYDRETGEKDYGALFSRYGMNLATGFVGGALSNLVTEFRENNIKNIGNMTNQQAMQELVHMIRNGEDEKFLRQVDKLTLADPNKSHRSKTDGRGNIDDVQGTKEDNLDLTTKRMIRLQVQELKEILEATGALLDDKSLFDNNTLHDLRFAELQRAVTTGNIMQKFNSLLTENARLKALINQTINEKLDTNKNGLIEDHERTQERQKEVEKELEKTTDTTGQKLDRLNKQYKENQKQLQDLIDGKYTYEFIRDALFEMTSTLSRITTLPLFAEQKYNKKWEDLSESEKALAQQEHQNWMKTDARTHLSYMAAITEHASRLSSKVLTEFFDSYANRKQMSQTAHEMLRMMYGQFQQFMEENDEMWLSRVEKNAPLVFALYLHDTAERLMDKDEREHMNELYDERDKIEKDYDAYQERLRNGETISKEEADNINQDIKDRRKDILKAIDEGYTDILYNHLSQIKDMFVGAGFASQEMKDNFTLISNLLANYLRIRSDETEGAKSDDLAQKASEIRYEGRDTNKKDWLQEILNLKETPFDDILDKYTISTIGESITFSNLVKQANLIYENVITTPTLFRVSDKTLIDLQNTKVILEMFRNVILAASVDNADFDNPYGFNKTLNEVSEKMGLKKPKLAEIRKSDTDYFVNEIDISLNKIDYLIRLNNLNRSQKLTRQDRVETNKNIIIHKRAKSLMSSLLDTDVKNWKGFDELYTAINSMSLHDKLIQEKRQNLKAEELETLLKERISLENAMYKFFRDNADKVSDPEELCKFINAKSFNLYTKGDLMLDEGTTSIDDNAFVWWLASCAALNGEAFLYRFGQILDPSRIPPIAPIPTHEFGVRMAYSMIINGTIFKHFKDALTRTMFNDWKSKSVADRLRILETLGKSALFAEDRFVNYSPDFLPATKYMSILLEGVAGAGKTKAIIAMVNELLKTFNKDIYEKITMVNAVKKEDAEKLKKSLLLPDSVKAWGTKDLMNFVLKDKYTPFDLNKNGKYEITKNNISEADNGNGFYEMRSSRPISQADDTPSVIIIDEVTRMLKYDYDAVADFCSENGIPLICCGDFTQLTVSGYHLLDMDILTELEKKDIVNTVSLGRTDFPRITRLGVSMRTGNTYMTGNQNKMLVLFANPNIDEVVFDYYQDASGLYGCKVIGMSPAIDEGQEQDQRQSAINGSIDSHKDIIMKEIDTLINYIKGKTDSKGEQIKIGYVYNNPSKITEELKKEKYKQYIDMFEGGSAQGGEGLYYIVESGDPYEDMYFRRINTGITRAEQGVLFLSLNAPGRPKFKSEKHDSLIQEVKDDIKYSEYTAQRKKLIEKVAKKADIKFTPMDGYKSTPIAPDNAPKPKEGGLKDTTTVKVDDAPSEYSDGEGNIGTGSLDIENNDAAITVLDWTSETNVPKITVDEDTGKVTVLFFLNATFETGVNINDTGHPEKIGGNLANKRIDSINGLWKMDDAKSFLNDDGDKVRTVDEYREIIALLRNAVLNSDNKQLLIEDLKSILELFGFNKKFTDGMYVTFAIKSSDNLGKDKRKSGQLYYHNTGNGSPFNKWYGEKNDFNGSYDERSKDVALKSIVMIVGNKDGDMFELPLSLWSSPLTVMKAYKIFAPIEQTFNNYINGNGVDKLSTRNAIVEIIKEYGEGGSKHNPIYDDLITLFKVFVYTNDRIAFIDDPQWTYDGTSKVISFGPQFSIERGEYMGDDVGLKYNANENSYEEWETLEEIGKNPTIRITSVLEHPTGTIEIDGKGYRYLPAGHCLVLESHDLSLDTDEAITSYFIEQIKAIQRGVKPKLKVRAYFILPPKADLETYFDNIKNVIIGEADKDTVKPIGQIVTSYKLLNILLNSDDKDLVEAFKNKFSEGFVDDVLKPEIENIRKAFKKSQHDGIIELVRQEEKWGKYGIGRGKAHIVTLLNRTLIKLAYNVKSFTSKSGPAEILEDKKSLDAVIRVLKANGVDGVFYDVKLPKADREVLPGGFIKVRLNGDKQYIDQYGNVIGSFKKHGKTDPIVFGSSDIMQWLEKFTNGNKCKNDYSAYIAGKSKIDTTTDTSKKGAKKGGLNPLKESDINGFFGPVVSADQPYFTGTVSENDARFAVVVNGTEALFQPLSLDMLKSFDYMDYAIDVSGVSRNSATEMEVIKPGRAIKPGDRWLIVEKAQVVLKGKEKQPDDSGKKSNLGLSFISNDLRGIDQINKFASKKGQGGKAIREAQKIYGISDAALNDALKEYQNIYGGDEATVDDITAKTVALSIIADAINKDSNINRIAFYDFDKGIFVITDVRDELEGNVPKIFASGGLSSIIRLTEFSDRTVTNNGISFKLIIGADVYQADYSIDDFALSLKKISSADDSNKKTGNKLRALQKQYGLGDDIIKTTISFLYSGERPSIDDISDDDANSIITKAINADSHRLGKIAFLLNDKVLVSNEVKEIKGKYLWIRDTEGYLFSNPDFSEAKLVDGKITFYVELIDDDERHFTYNVTYDTLDNTLSFKSNIVDNESFDFFNPQKDPLLIPRVYIDELKEILQPITSEQESVFDTESEKLLNHRMVAAAVNGDLPLDMWAELMREFADQLDIPEYIKYYKDIANEFERLRDKINEYSCNTFSVKIL